MSEPATPHTFRAPAIIKQFLASTTAALARAVLGAAPLPQTAAGAGQWLVQIGAAGAAWVLPVGGTWVCFGVRVNNGAFLTTIIVPTSGAVAGGTTVGAGAANNQWLELQWEILDARGFDSSKPIYKREDGSFVITAETGHPYHVLTHEQARAQGTKHDALYDAVAAYVAAHPETMQHEPQPPMVKADPQAVLTAEIMADLIAEKKKDPKWIARLDEIKKEPTT